MTINVCRQVDHNNLNLTCKIYGNTCDNERATPSSSPELCLECFRTTWDSSLEGKQDIKLSKKKYTIQEQKFTVPLYKCQTLLKVLHKTGWRHGKKDLATLDNIIKTTCGLTTLETRSDQIEVFIIKHRCQDTDKELFFKDNFISSGHNKILIKHQSLLDIKKYTFSDTQVVKSRHGFKETDKSKFVKIRELNITTGHDDLMTSKERRKLAMKNSPFPKEQ